MCHSVRALNDTEIEIEIEIRRGSGFCVISLFLRLVVNGDGC